MFGRRLCNIHFLKVIYENFDLPFQNIIFSNRITGPIHTKENYQKFTGNLREIFKKFPVNFRKISGKSSGIRKRENDITQRQNKFLINGLYENDPTIMPDSPVEYLRKCNFTTMSRLFPTRFQYKYIIYIQYSIFE